MCADAMINWNRAATEASAPIAGLKNDLSTLRVLFGGDAANASKNSISTAKKMLPIICGPSVVEVCWVVGAGQVVTWRPCLVASHGGPPHEGHLPMLPTT